MVVSGAAALADEVVWARMLREVFGSTVEAVSTVLGVFFAGLALGAWLGGRRAPRASRPGRAYAALELLIAAGVLATLPGVEVLARHVPAWEASVSGGTSGAWQLVRIALASLVLLPATMAMGATFPLMVQVAGGLPDRGRIIGQLYAANTVGGVAGAFVAGFLTLGTLGCRATLISAAAMNVAAALGAWLLLGDARSPPPPAPEHLPAAPGGRVSTVLVAAGVAGAGALAAEVVWTRAMVFGFGSSTYAFASILIAVLLAIAAGGAAYAPWQPAGRLDRALGLVLVCEGVLLALSAVTFAMLDLLALHATAIRMATVLPRPLTWPLLWIGVALVMAGPATLLSGYAFPLAAHARALEVGSSARGSGQASAVNTAGTIAGSLLAGFWLLPALGVRGALAAVAAAVAAVGTLLLVRRPAPRLGAAAAAGLGIWLLATRAGPPQALHADIERAGDRVLFARDGAQASVRVFEQAAGGATLRRLAIDGQTVASNGAGDLLVKEIALAHLPFLLHRAAERVALIGLGTGITLGAIAAHPEVRELVCVEIVPEVWAAARYFERENRRVLDDPRLTAVVGDGVQFLRGTARRFDVIVGDEKLSLHAAANGTFFSHDYYTLVRDRLAPAGVFVQWVPLLLPPADQATVLRSFFSVFPDGVVVTLGRFGFIQIGGVPTPGLAQDRAVQVLAQDALRGALTFPTLDLIDPVFIAASALGRRADFDRFVGPGPIQTADRPVLDYGIGRWDFRFETYRERAARMLGVFGDIVAATPSPWLDGVPDPDLRRRARTAAAALLEAHRREVLGDARGALAALEQVAGPEGLATLRPLADRYRGVLAGRLEAHGQR
jgi:spermidine synthase